MSTSARRTRRILGLAFLGAAILLLLAGQTLLRPHLRGPVFALYWLTCLGLVGLALFVAWLDLVILRQQVRRQQLELLRGTLGDPEQLPPTNRPRTTNPAPGAKD